jgi:hypothetical protein
MRNPTLVVALVAAALVSCKGEVVTDRAVRRGQVPYSAGGEVARVAVQPTVTAETWSTLAGTRVWFGHQSIGRNVLEGVRALADSASGHGATIATLGDAASVPATGAPLVVEFPIGENGFPLSKLEGFAAALDRLGPDARGVALFEYCFLDVTAATDVAALFERHRTDIAAMRAKHPGLTFVHMTVPLTVDEPLARRMVKGILGKPTSRDANAKRAAFNAMLRQEYAGEPTFDIARVESTLGDGSRVIVAQGADTVYALAPELSDDGAHLNAAGRRAAAAAFLATLATVVDHAPVVAQAPTR